MYLDYLHGLDICMRERALVRLGNAAQKRMWGGTTLHTNQSDSHLTFFQCSTLCRQA